MHLPDYPTDLNACHEMVSVMTPAQRGRMAMELYLKIPGAIQHDNDTVNESALADLINATAPQRCEAFLRTLNLWTDEPPQP